MRKINFIKRCCFILLTIAVILPTVPVLRAQAFGAASIEHVYITSNGSSAVGSTLTVNYTCLTEADENSFTYQWWSCNQDEIRACDMDGAAQIEGAVNKTYKLTSAEVGKYIFCVVTPKNGQSEISLSYGKVTVCGADSPSVDSKSMRIWANDMHIGSTLYAHYTYQNPNGGVDKGTKIQWQRADSYNGVYKDIEGETGNTYVLRPEDYGKFITFNVTVNGTTAHMNDRIYCTPENLIPYAEAIGDPIKPKGDCDTMRRPVMNGKIHAASDFIVDNAGNMTWSIKNSIYIFDAGKIIEWDRLVFLNATMQRIVKLEVSNDNSSWKTLDTEIFSFTTNTLVEYNLKNIAKGRYIRVTFEMDLLSLNLYTNSHLKEMQVYLQKESFSEILGIDSKNISYDRNAKIISEIPKGTTVRALKSLLFTAVDEPNITVIKEDKTVAADDEAIENGSTLISVSQNGKTRTEYQLSDNENIPVGSIQHGEYLKKRLIKLFDENSRGVIAFPEYEAMYDFDKPDVPKGLMAEKSSVEISDKYHGTTESRSLKWTTTGEGSRIVLSVDTTPFYFADAESVVGIALNSRWYLTLGLLQEAMPDDGVKRKFHVALDASGREIGGYDVYLHRDGWTFAGKQVWPERGMFIDNIIITQTGGSGGEFYVDDVTLYSRNVRDLRNTPYARRSSLYSEEASDSGSNTLTKEEKDAFEIIAQRAMPDPVPIAKLSETKMEEFREYYKFWEITPVEGTDFVNGYCPLYFHRAAPGDTVANRDNYVMNMDYYKLCTNYKALGYHYRAVQDAEQKAELEKYLVDIARLAITYSNVPDSWYTGAGFAEGAYYGRDALEKAGIASEISRQLKEQYSVDKILYSEHRFDNEAVISRTDTSGLDFNWAIDADSLFTAVNATMISLLVDADTPDKAHDMYLFKDYMDKLLMNYTPNTYGTLKPDGSLFHHWVNKYDYGWRQAWDGITKYIYWFSDTPFAPSAETLERISYFAEVRYRDLGIDGKGGVPGHQGAGISTDGILRLAKSGMYDGSLDIDPYRASEWLAYGNGGADAEKFLEMGIKPAAVPQSNLTESYAMKNIHRRSNWRVHTYGQNNLCRFNEYARPATLFFNMGGMLLDIPGQCAPMTVNPNDNIYGRDTFVPAQGYNFNRAPGVTAPDTADKTQLKATGKGSSPFVGGASAKNGNGVFTNQFDAADNTADYGNTVASDFRFKKSYFYFDDKIVCLASNIGYGGDEAVSTGLFQEKMTTGDNVSFSGGEVKGNEIYNKTYTSDERPWLSDNIGNAMYYLFPGQSYTVSRGEQEFLFKEKSSGFDGKGNFVSAYINHPKSDTSANNGKYAYVMIPGAEKKEMEALEKSMKSDVPELEILCHDDRAHAVSSNEADSIGYVIFDKAASFDFGEIKGVSSPSVIMAKSYDDGKGMSLAIADPNLRMDKTDDNPYGMSLSQKLTVTLKGKWNLKESADYTARDTEIPEIRFTSDGNTLFTINCCDGLTNEYLLEKADNPMSENVKNTFEIRQDSKVVYVNGIQSQYGVKHKDNTDFMALSDMADMLHASWCRNTAENRVECYYEDMQIIFTLNSKIATADNEIIILPSAVYEENGACFVPMSVLENILKTEPKLSGEKVIYTQAEALWLDWDKEPAENCGFIFTSEDDGTSILTPPESIDEGIFVMAVYQDGILEKMQICDLSVQGDDRSLKYTPAESKKAYQVRGFLFESMESMKPMLTNCLVYESN